MDPEEEEAYALKLHLKARQRLHSRVEQCCREGTCFCNYKMLGRFYGSKRRCFVSYHHEEKRNEDIQSALRSSMYSRSKLGPQQDQRPFRLMDLPVELRLRIYEIAFEIGNYQELAPRCSSILPNPLCFGPVDKFATKIFESSIGQGAFGSNFQSYMQNAILPTFSDRVWLTRIKEFNRIRRLRHVCFRLPDDVDMHDMHIDLDRCSVSNWLVPSGDTHLNCSCQAPSTWTVLQWREHISNNAHLMLGESQVTWLLKRIDRCIELADKAVERFQVVCRTVDGRCLPRMSGLAYLAQAAWFILNIRSWWMNIVNQATESEYIEQLKRELSKP